jgi:hypothetical protein
MTETLQVVPHELDELRQELLQSLTQLAAKHGWSWKGKPRTTSLAKLLTSNLCERRVDYLLRNPEHENTKFDPIYREKSQYAVRFIIDHLKSRLLQEGINARVATEVKDDFGTYDVTILQAEPILILRDGEAKVRLEVKASLGLPLEQVDRYLWNPSLLILVRVITGHVMLLRPQELGEFVEFSLRTTLEKACRLNEEKCFAVPGNYCSNCPDEGCPFYEQKRFYTHRLVKMTDSDFGIDMTSFLTHLPYAARRTADLVIEELRRPSEGLA